VLDLAATFDLTEQVALFARVENLLDEDYLAARRPAGARPGRPQTALLGVNVTF
jgi:Fe(3+) dicitrate transport protein